MSRLLQLSKRMKYLRTVEAGFSVALLPALALYWLSASSQVAWTLRGIPLVLVCYILGQGALYWELKYRQYEHSAPLPLWLPAVFRGFRLSNTIGLGVATLALAVAATRGTPNADLGWLLACLPFAVLEHINYYHYQLMYDTRGALRRLRRTRRLRTPVLAIDIERVSLLRAGASVRGLTFVQADAASRRGLTQALGPD